MGGGRRDAGSEGLRLVKEYILDEEDGGQDESNQLQRAKEVDTCN